MKFKTLLISTLAACLISSIAQAEGKSPKGDQDGERNGPPKQEKRDERFSKIDTDSDGMLSLDEVKTADETRLTEHFNEIDADSDGLISKDELKAARKRGPKDKGEKDGPKDKGEKGPKAACPHCKAAE